MEVERFIPDGKTHGVRMNTGHRTGIVIKVRFGK